MINLTPNRNYTEEYYHNDLILHKRYYSGDVIITTLISNNIEISEKDVAEILSYHDAKIEDVDAFVYRDVKFDVMSMPFIFQLFGRKPSVLATEERIVLDRDGNVKECALCDLSKKETFQNNIENLRKK